MNDHARLISEMINYEAGNPQRVHHFLKVYGFARAIGELEGLDANTQYILEAASIVHDIGIKPSVEKHGDDDGSLQEVEGPPLAEEMLSKLNFDDIVIRRVSYLVAHHHSYDNINGQDYQILVEADFLVNILEGNFAKAAIDDVYDNIFKTENGKRFFEQMFYKGQKS